MTSLDYPCREDGCDFIGHNEASLRMHTSRRHLGIGPGHGNKVACEVCGRPVAPSYLERHMAKHHKELATQAPLHDEASTELVHLNGRKPRQVKPTWRELEGFKLLTLTGEDIWIAEQIR
jgi:hypothetical protein